MSIRFPLGLWVILFIALLAILVAGPFWQIDGIPVNTRDVQVHLHRSAAIERAFEQGVYWPRWFPAVYNGLGAPVFHYYSPGLHWLVAAGHGIGLGLDQALKLLMTAGLLVSGFGVFAWLRYAFSPAACLAATSLYLLHPMLLTRTVYFGGDYPQILALLILPVCLWAITALHAHFSVRNLAAATVSLAALVVSHNLMAMAGMAILFVYWLMLAAGYRKLDGLIRCSVATAVAALLTAGFWLPALADLPLLQFENTLKRLAHFSTFFLNWWQLIGFQTPVLDSRAGNPLRPLNTFGAATWLALTAGLLSVLFAVGRERRVWGLCGVLFTLAMLFMASPLSYPAWDSLPGLRIFLFPSRFLLIAPIGALPAAALAVDAWGRGRRWLPSLFFVAASVLVLFPYLFPAHTPMFSPFLPVETLSPRDTRAYEPLANAWGMTSFNEFLVQGGDMRVITGEIAEPDATSLTWRSPHEAVADLSGQKEPLLLRLHFHPAWSAGDKARLTQGPAGWVRVTEVQDRSEPLVIRWQGTVWQRWGDRLSLLGMLATVAGALFFAIHRRKGETGVNAAQSASTRTVGVMTACVLVFVVARFALNRSAQGPFLRHSPPGQLAFAVEGQPATLGDDAAEQVTLLGWELLSRTTPRPGDTISVRLYWQAHSELDHDYHTFLHLYTPSLQRSWAVKNQGVLRPPTRVWDPRKYYIETMHLSLPEDIPPVTYTLVAGLVTSSGERLTVPGSINDLLHLREMAVTPTRPGFLQQQRPSVAARAETDDGLRLQGYDLIPTTDDPGHLSLRLFWETGDGAAHDWVTYIHLTDAQGNLTAQFDGPALAGLQPTSSWNANALYIDRRQLDLPAELSPGNYLFRVGLYSFSNGERLPFQPEDVDQPHFENGQLLIPLLVPHSSDAPGVSPASSRSAQQWP